LLKAFKIVIACSVYYIYSHPALCKITVIILTWCSYASSTFTWLTLCKDGKSTY